MHVSSLEHLRLCLKKHVVTDPFVGSRPEVNVVDIGSADVNGSYRGIFDLLGCTYHGVDLASGPGVDTVLDDPYQLPFANDTFDIAFSGQTFEHAEHFWKLFDEMCRITCANGLIIVMTPSSGPVHRYPVDCYRFNADSMKALASNAGVELVDSWTSEFGPWYDTVGVFRKGSHRDPAFEVRPDTSLKLAQPVQNTFPPNVPDEVEVGAGTEDCYDFLVRAHQILKPQFYVEIGVEYGKSLQLADCPALGIDPAPQITERLDPRHQLSLTTSDDFYWLTDRDSMMKPIDLCYVDGMHQIEFALRDFMYMETYCHAGSVVVIDDIYPAHALQGERVRQSRYWTGDVWKIINLLRNARPDLVLVPLDTSPTGSLLVIGCDPTNTTLWEKYDVICDWAINLMTEVPGEIVRRSHALDPRDPLITRILSMIARSRGTGQEQETVFRVRHLLDGSFPRTVVAS